MSARRRFVAQRSRGERAPRERRSGVPGRERHEWAIASGGEVGWAIIESSIPFSEWQAYLAGFFALFSAFASLPSAAADSCSVFTTLPVLALTFTSSIPDFPGTLSSYE